MNKKKTLLYISLFASFTLLSGGCSNKKEKILSRDKMVAIVYDIQLAESMFQIKYNDFLSREAKDAVVNSILDKHGVTQAQLDSSLVWYSDNAEVYIRVNDSIIAFLKRDIQIMESNMPNRRMHSINDDIIPGHFFITSEQPLITFSLDSVRASNYNNFDLEFKTLGFSQIDSTEFSITYIYKDTLIQEKYPIKQNTSVKTNSPFANDSIHHLKGIEGYIYTDPISLHGRKPLIYNIVLKNRDEETKKDSIN